MRKIITVILTLSVLIALIGCVSTSGGKTMTVTSTGITGDVIAAKYGQFGQAADINEKNPATDSAGKKVIMKVNTRSFAVSIKDAPQGSKAYAIFLHDPDAAVHGFGDFVHWTTVFTTPDLSEGASKNPPAGMIQGVNGWGDNGYAGMGPPDKLGYTLVSGGPTFQGTHDFHTYVMEVWALDSVPALKEGFTLEELQAATNGKILAKTTVTAKYFASQADFK